MTPQYILRKSLCRPPHCAGPSEVRDKPLKDWPQATLDSWRKSATDHIEYMEYASEYGEPGYDNPKRGILFANWNYFPRGVDELLERAGYAIEWSDEWAIVYETGKAYRTSPDSYGWKRSLVYGEDGHEFCRDDVEDYIDHYIEHLLDDPTHCDLFDVNWAKHGFVNMNGVFEAGWHPHQTDDPRKILREHQTKFPDKEFLFQVPSVGQFDISFTIWGRDRTER